MQCPPHVIYNDVTQRGKSWARSQTESSECEYTEVSGMPLEGLEEEGLPKNPDLQLVQWKFQLTVGEVGEAEKEEIWGKLLAAIKENCTLLARLVPRLSIL